MSVDNTINIKYDWRFSMKYPFFIQDKIRHAEKYPPTILNAIKHYILINTKSQDPLIEFELKEFGVGMKFFNEYKYGLIMDIMETAFFFGINLNYKKSIEEEDQLITWSSYVNEKSKYNDDNGSIVFCMSLDGNGNKEVIIEYREELFNDILIPTLSHSLKFDKKGNTISRDVYIINNKWTNLKDIVREIKHAAYSNK